MTGSTYSPQRWVDVEASKVQPNVVGVKGTASANTTTNIDQQIVDDSMIRGISPIVQNTNFGDTIDVYVIDIDGVYFPVNTIIGHPVKNYYVETNTQAQMRYQSVAPFKLLGGLYIRFAYKNINLLTAAQLQVNLELLTVLI